MVLLFMTIGSARLLRNEIDVPNKNNVLNVVSLEVLKLHSLLSKKNFLLHSTITKKYQQSLFKKIGLKPKHIQN